jgi:hypothetical protein
MLSPQTKEEIMGDFLKGTKSVVSRMSSHGAKTAMLRKMSDRQKAMIDSHWHEMDDETKKRATLVKSGDYHGQLIT